MSPNINVAPILSTPYGEVEKLIEELKLCCDDTGAVNTRMERPLPLSALSCLPTNQIKMTSGNRLESPASRAARKCNHGSTDFLTVAFRKIM